MEKKDCAKAVLYALIEAYNDGYDIERILDCLSEDIQWIGIRNRCVVSGKEELRRLFEEDRKKLRYIYRVRIEEITATDWSDDCVMLTVISRQTEIPGMASDLRICSTIICKKTAEGWKISHIHNSPPDIDEDKYFPQMESAHEKQKLLLRSIPGGVAIYRIKKNGNVETEYVSEGLAAMCGYTAAEFLAYLREDAKINIVAEDRQRVMQSVMSSLETGEEISAVYRIFTKEKEQIDIQLNANISTDMPLGEEDVAVIYAVHAKLSAEAKAIRQEEERYRAILDYLDVAYFEWIPEKGFHASEKYKRYAMSQVDYGKILHNEGPGDLVHPDDLPILRHFFAMASQKLPQASVTLRCKLTDGSYRWTEMMGFFNYGPTGQRTKTMAVLRDVNEEWQKQNEKLQAALSEAQKANQAKTDFLSRVSHDMRTPLNGILGLASLLSDKTDDIEILHDLEKMKASGRYLLNLINDTLDVSRIENGKMELRPSVCVGQDILDCVLALAGGDAERKGIHLLIDTERLRFNTLYVDSGRLEQVLVNILGNAVKFTPPGGTIRFSLETLGEKNKIITDRFTIEDNGSGINSEFLPHLFEPFSQEKRQASSSLQGTGLGMAITHSIVQQMGGQITVESEEGRGTKFTVLLPLPLATREQAAAYHGTQNADYDASVLKGARVLLCEDHPLNAEIVKRMLAKKEILVEHAENGLEGVEMFRSSSPGYYQAILMDICMPVMDGIEAARQIRSIERKDAETISMIALSANAFSEDVERAKAAGMSEYLSKPFEPETVYRILACAIAAAKKKRDNGDEKH